jgi:hypothetical protein
MSFLDSPLGERLQEGLESGKPDDIAEAVVEIESMVWSSAVDKEQVGEVLDKLLRHRQFQHVIGIGDAAIAVGSRQGRSTPPSSPVRSCSTWPRTHESAVRSLVSSVVSTRRGSSPGPDPRTCSPPSTPTDSATKVAQTRPGTG